MGYKYMNIKDITIPLIIHYYLRTRHSEHYTNLSTLNHSIRFLCVSAPGRWHNAIRVRAKPCACIIFNYSRTLPQRSSPSGLLDIVNPGIQ